MFRSPEAYPSSALCQPFVRLAALAMVTLLSVGCGNVTCPDALVDAEGFCVKRESSPEVCDGVDNDGDMAIDEDWPELGEPCGEGSGVGECVAGTFVCAADAAGVVCEGAVGPTAEACDDKDNDCDGIRDNGPPEVCDGEDNDCDGLIDEGVLAVKKEAAFDGFRSVASVEGGFAVTRVFGGQLRIETYDDTGSRTGHNEDLDTDIDVEFLDSDSRGNAVYLTWGELNYFAAEARVDADLVPVIVESHQLHETWTEAGLFSLPEPPYHPRVDASMQRIVGYPNVFDFATIVFGDDLSEVTRVPTLVPALPPVARYDAAGIWIAWGAVEDTEIKAAWLLNDGRLALEARPGLGSDPGLTVTSDGPALVSLRNGDVQLSELDAVTLQCREGGLCSARLAADDLLGPARAPADLAYHDPSDTWFIVAGRQIIAVGRDGTDAVVKQLDERADPAGPDLVDVVVSGDTVAVTQSDRDGSSALTFLGCF